MNDSLKDAVVELLLGLADRLIGDRDGGTVVVEVVAVPVVVPSIDGSEVFVVLLGGK